jgi:hypothetical protein
MGNPITRERERARSGRSSVLMFSSFDAGRIDDRASTFVSAKHFSLATSFI